MRTAVIIVNWNSWEDTARCIEAVLKLNGYAGAIFVCDNGSTDGSREKLIGWAEGSIRVEADSDAPEIKSLTTPVAPRPLVILAGDEATLSRMVQQDGASDRAIYLLRSEINLGFAGGNNIALRTALTDTRFELFWLLNADAVPAKEALAELQACYIDETQPMLVGSVILEYSDPCIIQARGARFNKWLLTSHHRDEGKPTSLLAKLPRMQYTDYPIGASLVMNKSFLLEQGLLEERLFLYFEEIDLARRLTSDRVLVCNKSLVYHKGGASTNTGIDFEIRSDFADRCMIYSRVVFASKLGFSLLCLSLIVSFYSILKRVVLGKFRRAANGLTSVILAMSDK